MRAAALVLLLALAGCRDLSGFDTAGGGSYQGAVIDAPFVLAGIDGGTMSLCVTLDTNHLQDTPGKIWSSDGRFQGAALRTIPQIWQDPLSTFTFGEGRLKNLLYVARADQPFSDGQGNDVFVVLSLMQAGDLEARLVRGAPFPTTDGGASSTEQNVFAVFDMNRQSGSCSF